MIVEAEKDWILRAKTGWEGRRLVGRWVIGGPLALFLALNMGLPTDGGSTLKRGYSAGHSYIIRALPPQQIKCSRPLKRG